LRNDIELFVTADRPPAAAVNLLAAAREPDFDAGGRCAANTGDQPMRRKNSEAAKTQSMRSSAM
jgi:hypothetical protein